MNMGTNCYTLVNIIIDWIKMTGWVGGVAAIVSLPAAWMTHFLWAAKILITYQLYNWEVVAIAFSGVIFPPIGIIHGYILWLS